MKQLYQKLLLIQKELGAIKKEEDNPFFKSKYFDINALAEHVKPLLSAHGLILLQPLTQIDGKTALATILAEVESGESMEYTVLLPENLDPQKMGSAITYFRRYAVQSLLFLQAEDDDGNKAVPAPRPSVRHTEQKAVGALEPFELDGYEYVSGVSQKNGKTWYARQKIGTRDKEWLQAFEYDKACVEAQGRQSEPTPEDLPY